MLLSWIFCQLQLSKPLLKLSETLYEIVKQREPVTQQAVWRSKKRQGEMVCVLNNSPNTWQATVGYQKMEWNKDDDKNIKAAVSFWTSSPFFEGPWSKVWSFHTRKYAAALLSTYQVFYRPFRRCSAYERTFIASLQDIWEFGFFAAQKMTHFLRNSNVSKSNKMSRKSSKPSIGSSFFVEKGAC